MTRRINIVETAVVQVPSIKDSDKINFSESAKTNKELPDKITTIVEAIHSGLTRNYTFYPADNLEKSTESWTNPFEKPVIKNHDIHEEPLGRVMRASFKQSNLAPDKHTIELELEITDPDAIRKVLDGRYKTLSIGGSTTSAVCNICGKDLVKEGFCGHMKGRTYEGKQAHWILGEMNFDEISWVNVPADSNAQVVNKNVSKQTESVSTEEGGMDMDQHTADILEQIDELAGKVVENKEENPKDPVLEPDASKQAEDNKPEGNAPEGDNPDASKQKEEDEKPEGTEKTLQEQLDEANDRIATLEADNLTLTADKEALQEEVETLKTEKATLAEEVEQLKSDLDLSESDRKALKKQSVTLASYTHKVLAESVATVQKALGKIDEDKFEESLADLSKETSRSLKEQLAELGKEKPVRVVQTIDNPAHVGGDDNPEDIAESTKQKPKEKLTLQEFANKINAAMNRQFD